jgi:hypothetical protein
MKLAELQTRFGKALLRGNDALLADCLCDEGIAAESLLELYRNSMFCSLTSVLGNTFTTVRAILGEEAFRRTVEVFVRVQPPPQPCLNDYGENFPDFLETADVGPSGPYLANVARLDWFAHGAPPKH